MIPTIQKGKTCTELVLLSGNFSISFRAQTTLSVVIMYTNPPELCIIIIKLNNNNSRNNTPCVCCVWLCQYGHWSSDLLNYIPALLVCSCLFVSPNYHRGLSHRVSYIFLWFIPKGTHTLLTHCMSEIIREKKWVSGGEEQLQKRGEEGRLGIIKYSKTTTTTFGWEIIGCSIEVGVSWHCFSVAAINNHYMVLHRVRKKRDASKWSYYGHIQVSVNQSWCCTPTIYNMCLLKQN